MGRPRQVSDEEILEVARACFLEQGPGVSTTVIAERLGVSQAALFKRFRTKEELMLAALKPGGELPWAGRIMAGPDGGDVREQLIEIGTEVLEFLDRLIPCIAVLRSAGMGPEQLRALGKDAPPVRTQKLLADWFERAMEQGLVRRCDADAAATTFFAALQLRAFVRHLGAEALFAASPRAYAERIVELLWDGIAPENG